MKKFKNRGLRTVFLALFATLTFVGSAIFIFDVEPQVMWHFFLVSLLGVGLVIVAAIGVSLIGIALKRLLTAR